MVTALESPDKHWTRELTGAALGRMRSNPYPPGSRLLTAVEAHSSGRKETKQRSRRGGLAPSRLEAQGGTWWGVGVGRAKDCGVLC